MFKSNVHDYAIAPLSHSRKQQNFFPKGWISSIPNQADPIALIDSTTPPQDHKLVTDIH